jgi:hypothetical protein
MIRLQQIGDHHVILRYICQTRPTASIGKPDQLQVLHGQHVTVISCVQQSLNHTIQTDGYAQDFPHVLIG